VRRIIMNHGVGATMKDVSERAKMSAVFTMCTAVELLLVVLEGVWPRAAKSLPLGGSHLAQVGVLFGSAWFFIELFEGLQRAFVEAFGG